MLRIVASIRPICRCASGSLRSRTIATASSRADAAIPAYTEATIGAK